MADDNNFMDLIERVTSRGPSQKSRIQEAANKVKQTNKAIGFVKRLQHEHEAEDEPDNFANDKMYKIKDEKKYQGAKKEIVTYEFLPPNVKILQVACTLDNTYVLTTSGFLFSWGRDKLSLGRDGETQYPGPIPLQHIVQIVTGDRHAMALDASGCVYVWGSNDSGQLGFAQNIQQFEKPQKLDKFDGQCVQIYAGHETSFVVTRDNCLWYWGKRERNYFSPQKVIGAPWEKKQAPVIVTGKGHRGWIYTMELLQQHGIMGGDDNTKIKELEEEILQLKIDNKEWRKRFIGESENLNVDLQRKLEDDKILPSLIKEVSQYEQQIKFIKDRIERLDKDIANIDKDLRVVKEQLDDIERREEVLSDQIQFYEGEIIKKRRDQNAKENERQKKTSEELYRANEQIKNMIQEKQKEKQEKRIDLIEERDNLIKQQKTYTEKKQMANQLIAERKENIAQKLFSKDQSDIKQMVHLLHNKILDAKECMIDRKAKHFQNEKGLADILKESSIKLNALKEEIKSLSLSKQDALYSDTQKILDVFKDSIDLRKEINEYAYSLVLLSERQLDNSILSEIIQKNKVGSKRQDPERASRIERTKTEKMRGTMQRQTMGDALMRGTTSGPGFPGDQGGARNTDFIPRKQSNY